MPVGHIHTGDPPYAPPLLRAASPSSSIGTDYGPDATSPVEAQMSPDQFSIICEQRLFLKLPKMEEIEANKNPLLPRPKVEKQDMRKYEREMQGPHHRICIPI